MAGPIVDYDAGKFTWAYTAGSVPATELRLKWGTAPNTYPNQKVYAPATTGADVHDVLAAGSKGQFYAILVSANAKGEGVKSGEVPFLVTDGLPDGSLSLSVG